MPLAFRKATYKSTAPDTRDTKSVLSEINTTVESRADTGPCAASGARDRRLSSAEDTMNCATSSVPPQPACFRRPPQTSFSPQDLHGAGHLGSCLTELTLEWRQAMPAGTGPDRAPGSAQHPFRSGAVTPWAETLSLNLPQPASSEREVDGPPLSRLPPNDMESEMPSHTGIGTNRLTEDCLRRQR